MVAVQPSDLLSGSSSGSWTFVMEVQPCDLEFFRDPEGVGTSAHPWFSSQAGGKV